MKTQVSNELILEAHKSACNEWKLKIEKECPELFESKNGWYKDKNEENKDWLLYKDFVNNRIYGFNGYGNWVFKEIVLKVDYENEYLATEQEVKEALIKEAKKRGFKEGIGYKNWYLSKGKIKDNCWFFNFEDNSLSQINNGYGILHYIFNNGKWAEIISNPIEEKINDLQKQLDELKKQL